MKKKNETNSLSDAIENNPTRKIGEREFISLLCNDYLNCDFDTARFAVRAITDAIMDCAVNNIEVKLPGFGVFGLFNRKRRYYDPMKGTVVSKDDVPLVTIKFKCSYTLKKRIRNLVAGIEPEGEETDEQADD